MRVLAIKDDILDGTSFITKGKWYESSDTTHESDGLYYYSIVEDDLDDGSGAMYDSTLFKTLTEVRNERLKELLSD